MFILVLAKRRITIQVFVNPGGSVELGEASIAERCRCNGLRSRKTRMDCSSVIVPSYGRLKDAGTLIAVKKLIIIMGCAGSRTKGGG